MAISTSSLATSRKSVQALLKVTKPIRSRWLFKDRATSVRKWHTFLQSEMNKLRFGTISGSAICNAAEQLITLRSRDLIS